MACFSVKALLFAHLSVLLLSSFTILGDEFDVIWARAPHTLPDLPPVEPPKAHKGHHHHHIHPPVKHPVHPPVQPPVHPPVKSPVVHPPVKPPVYPPVKPPVHPPVKPPVVHPPVKPPVYPPVKPPVHPPVKPPVVHPPFKPPVYPPVKPPVHPPVKPPVVHPPVKPPVHPPVHPPRPPVPRKFVAVQGVVYCKSCKYTGIDTLTGASPLAGALVRLQCNNTKYPLVEDAKTDKNGYFIITPKKLTTAGSHKCKVSLVSSPLTNCSQPTDLHAGKTGAILTPSQKLPVPAPPAKPPKFELFTVGPFAFEPPKRCY